MKVKMKVAQSYLTLCDPMDCSLPAASVLGILQARRLEWVAVLFSRFPWICHALSCKFLINCRHNNKYDGTLLSRIFFLEESKGLLALVILGQTGEVGAGI